jgi:exonuclease SbcD
LEDQEVILQEILSVIDREGAEGIFIAGDVYDKSVPSAEAVQLFDSFLVALAERKLQVFVISGNHDSPERIAFGGKIMGASGIHLSPVYDGKVIALPLQDGYGEINVYMLPFIKPAHVRRYYAEEEINSYTDAMRVAISKMQVDKAKRNVLITHQFVTGATRSESEETVGGTDNVDASVFEGFDYVALGHIHGAQYCSKENIRYCGTPLKYSFSEWNDRKSVTVLEFLSKEEGVKIQTVELKPLRDLKKLTGTFAKLTDPDYYLNNPIVNDYLQIILTDEDDIPNAMQRLQAIYKHALNLKYDNARTRADLDLFQADGLEQKSSMELFEEFFRVQNNAEMTETQRAYMQELIESVEEGEV